MNLKKEDFEQIMSGIEQVLEIKNIIKKMMITIDEQNEEMRKKIDYLEYEIGKIKRELNI